MYRTCQHLVHLVRPRVLNSQAGLRRTRTSIIETRQRFRDVTFLEKGGVGGRVPISMSIIVLSAR